MMVTEETRGHIVRLTVDLSADEYARLIARAIDSGDFSVQVYLSRKCLEEESNGKTTRD
jgi:hypothetical protein